MLPGFRFLFAAIVLSMSILVFGLGAAALLRAAHEEFASAPPWHATPETVFAQQSEAAKPVLAMLRVEPQATEQQAADKPAAPLPTEQAAIAQTQVEPEKIAALRSEDSPSPEAATPLPETTSSTEAAKLETPAAEGPSSEPAAASEAAAQADAPASVAGTKIAAIGDGSPPASEAVPADPKPALTDTDAATKIATLGGPAVAIEGQAPAPQPVTSYVRQRRHVRRAAPHRRIARTQAAPAGDAFNQPTIRNR